MIDSSKIETAFQSADIGLIATASMSLKQSVLAFEFSNQTKMNRSLARFSSFWEDPQFHQQSLTWSQVLKLPVMKYEGHNMTKSAYETALTGLYPLTPEEKLISSKIQQSHANYIFAYVKDNDNVCEHERYHAVYDQNPDYQAHVAQIWNLAENRYDKWVKTFTTWLLPTYHQSVWLTEFQAYLLTEPKTFHAPSELIKCLQARVPVLPSIELIEKVSLF